VRNGSNCEIAEYVWAYRGAPKRFSFRVAYRGVRERDEGTLSPEETVSVGG